MITKILTSWTKDFSKDAWSAILNAINGSWGELSLYVINDQEITIDINKNRYDHYFTTTQTGSQTLNLPGTLSGIGTITVWNLVGTDATLYHEYVITSETTTTVYINLPTNSSLIRIQGKIRRL